MKNENYNLNINTLDDKIMYQEVCKKIKETDDISFKLIGLVPLVSGAGMVTLWSQANNIPVPALIFIGIFGALVTYFIYRWERRNIQICETFKNFAAEMESRKQGLDASEDLEIKADGPYQWLNSQEKPTWRGRLDKKGWGKTQAEMAIYGCTILFWLLFPLMATLI